MMNNTTNEQMVKISPFGYFKGEKTSMISPGELSYAQITDMDKVVLICINRLQLTTSALLGVHLENLGLTVDKTALQQRLKRLWQAGFLEKYQFVNPEGTYSASKVYILGYRGNGYLRSINERPRKTQYIKSVMENDSAQAKRLLSASQYAIRNHFAEFDVAQAVLVPVPNKPAKHIFRAHTLIQQNDKTVIVESLRRADGEIEAFIGKLRRINEVIKRKAKANAIITSAEIMLVCENEEHMTECIKCLENEKLPDLNIKITCDLDVYQGDRQPEDINIKKPFWSFFRFAA